MTFLSLSLTGHNLGLAKTEESYLRLINPTNSCDGIVDCALLTAALTKVASKQGERPAEENLEEQDEEYISVQKKGPFSFKICAR